MFFFLILSTFEQKDLNQGDRGWHSFGPFDKDFLCETDENRSTQRSIIDPLSWLTQILNLIIKESKSPNFSKIGF